MRYLLRHDLLADRRQADHQPLQVTPEILRAIRKINRGRRVTILCIAFGEESDLLKKLAEENGGVYRFVDPERKNVTKNEPPPMG